MAAARSLDPATLDDPELRGPGAGEAASIVARIPQVRAALLQFQRAFAAQPAGAVLDGRDIGTVVCPDADVKIYVTATPEVRARAPPSGIAGPGRSHHLRGRAGRYPPPRRARCRPRGGPHAPRRRRRLAGYHRFGYRSGIRYRCRRDPEEGWPTRARLRAALAIQLAKAHRRQNSTIMSTRAGLRAALGTARQAPSRPLDAAPNRRNRSRNEHRRH